MCKITKTEQSTPHWWKIRAQQNVVDVCQLKKIQSKPIRLTDLWSFALSLNNISNSPILYGCNTGWFSSQTNGNWCSESTSYSPQWLGWGPLHLSACNPTKKYYVLGFILMILFYPPLLPCLHQCRFACCWLFHRGIPFLPRVQHNEWPGQEVTHRYTPEEVRLELYRENRCRYRL